jgi:hypothetical protein
MLVVGAYGGKPEYQQALPKTSWRTISPRGSKKMSGSLGQRDQVEIRDAIDEESEQELTTEENNTTSGKDEEEGNDESFDSRLSFKAWLLQIDKKPLEGLRIHGMIIRK